MERSAKLRMLKSLFLTLAVVFLTVAFNPFVLSASAQDYLIGSQDVLKITVFEHPDLTTETRVSEDGKITFPLLGEIEAKNLTTRQVEKSIADKLSKSRMVNEPQVNVFVEQYMGRRVTIIGEVIKPGQYQISGPTTLLDVIALALGTNQNAGYLLTVFRKEKGDDGKESTKKITVDVERLLNGGDLSLNIELQNLDVVYVPKAVFYIYGEVNKPGAYRLEKGITVKRAIAIAGGLTPKGSQLRIEITRRDGEKETLAGADIDNLVQFDDVIRIKESIF
jgi:polysaccharide export outer membrane protein